MLLCVLVYVFARSRIEDCIAVFGNDYQICDSILEQIPTFGELDKMNIMSNRLKWNKSTWHLLEQWIDLR